jgi:hypothetical protein
MVRKTSCKLTDYHAKYYAHELTKRYPSDSVEKLAGAVASAQVDLNPHQVRTRSGRSPHMVFTRFAADLGGA